MTRQLTLVIASAAALAAAPFGAAPLGAQTVIDFEGLATMSNLPGAPVPTAARLADQFLAQGVRFSSSSPFIAVVNLAVGAGKHATSGFNGIGGVAANGALSYSAPIVITLVDPLDPSRPATTNAFSIRNDLQGLGAAFPFTVALYDVAGALISRTSRPDDSGVGFSAATPGIHRIVVTGNGTSAFDDITLGAISGPVTAAPEPATLSLLASGLALLGLAARRRRRTA